MPKELSSIAVKGHIHIEDDLGNVLLDKNNAIHPQNMSRVIARALANENNFYIHRIAFGNGGTLTDAAYTITYRPQMMASHLTFVRGILVCIVKRTVKLSTKAIQQ
jgi:hypothetical protein